MKKLVKFFPLKTIVATITLCIFSSSVFGIVNGWPATSIKYSAIGAIKSNNKIICTGTLISNKWIVTARHCFDDFETNEGEVISAKASSFEFNLGNDSSNPFFKSKIKRWLEIPDVKIGSEHKVIDLVFAELAFKVPLEKFNIKTIMPLILNWTLLDLEANYTVIGYGARAPFSISTSHLERKRQLANFKVTSTNGNFLINLFFTKNKFEDYVRSYHSNEIDLEIESIDRILRNEFVKGYNIHAWDARGRSNLSHIEIPINGWQDTCFGDSGGPLLREIEGNLQIVGVVSHGMNGTCATLGTVFTIFGKEVQKIMNKILF